MCTSEHVRVVGKYIYRCTKATKRNGKTQIRYGLSMWMCVGICGRLFNWELLVGHKSTLSNLAYIYNSSYSILHTRWRGQPTKRQKQTGTLCSRRAKLRQKIWEKPTEIFSNICFRVNQACFRFYKIKSSVGCWIDQFRFQVARVNMFGLLISSWCNFFLHAVTLFSIFFYFRFQYFFVSMYGKQHARTLNAKVKYNTCIYLYMYKKIYLYI